MVQEGMRTLGCGTDSPRDGNCALGSAISEGKRSCPFEVLREGQGVHISRVDGNAFTGMLPGWNALPVTTVSICCWH